MSKPVNETTTFRHRGFKNSVSGVIVQIFGNDPAPVATDGSTYEVEWDHQVTTSTIVSDPIISGAV